MEGKRWPSWLQPRDGPRILLFCRSRAPPLACLSAVCRARYASPTPARVERSRPCQSRPRRWCGERWGRARPRLDWHGKLRDPAWEAASASLKGGDVSTTTPRCEYVYNAQTQVLKGSMETGYRYLGQFWKDLVADGGKLVFSLCCFIDQFIPMTHQPFELCSSF